MPAVASTADLEELLRSRGLSPTRRRVEVLRELSREGNDVTAQLPRQRLRDRGHHLLRTEFHRGELSGRCADCRGE